MTRLPGFLRAAFAALAAAIACTPAQAADECTQALARRKVTIVVPFKPGGGYDLYARLLAPVLQEQTGARVAVTNIAGGNGLTGMRAIEQAAADSATLGVFDLRDTIGARMTDPAQPAASDFVPLGSFGSTVGMWAGREAAAALVRGSQPITAGVSTGYVPRVLLPAMLMGREVKGVRGFGGFTERWLAMLRGDVDIVDGSNDSIARSIASAPGTMPLMVMSVGPSAVAPGTPYLAGPGGVVDERTRALDAATRKQRMELAELSAYLSESQRTVVIGRRAQPVLRQCLEAAVERALFSPQLRDAAQRQKAALEPMRAVAVRAQLSRVEQAMKAHEALLRRLAAAQ
jgi:hypothetical protein